MLACYTPARVARADLSRCAPPPAASSQNILQAISNEAMHEANSNLVISPVLSQVTRPMIPRGV